MITNENPAVVEPRASIFTVAQEAELRRLKAYFPYRIVWGSINPQDESFEAHADLNRHRINACCRKVGWLVATIG